MRVPIIMCHGIRKTRVNEKALMADHFAALIGIASELGFESVSYDQLAAWREGTGVLPKRPLMIDFDHPVISMRQEVFEILSRHGYRGNLFVNTGMLDEMYRKPLLPVGERPCMTWEELAELMEAGWGIGGHTVTHPNLSELSKRDPTGEKIRAELLANNEALRRHLGRAPRDFAFTGTSWSCVAEREVQKLYRFGRLWIVGAEYEADGAKIRYADLAGVSGDDEADGGPPAAARYITRETPAHRLPSMEIEGLIYERDAFRRYLEGASGA